MSGLAIQEATERAVALRGALAERVVIADGAMGTMLQVSDVTPEDFDGHDGCNEVLNVTRPDVVGDIHRAYLAAGADCVTTNTFGANLGNLNEYGIPERIGELSQAGAAVARDAADEFTAADGRPRWVLGSIGPGTKLPTLGHVTFRELRDSYYENAAGLLRGGADALIIETCPDLLQAKAAIIGTKRAVADLAPGAVVIASRKALDPLALVRSPIARNAVSWRNGTWLYSDATPGSGRGERAFAATPAGRAGVTPRRSTSAATCSGVVPQHPPTRESPNSRANRSCASASSAAVSG